jgi:hypothetical protein
MKKNIILSGVFAGVFLAAVMVISTSLCYQKEDFEGSMLIGYASMILAFSVIFVAVKNFRDKVNSGFVTFGKAFGTGLIITVIASSVYVLVWLVDYYLFIPDFMDKYGAHMIREAKREGASQAELSKTAAEVANYKEMYKNPLVIVLMTYLEIIPVGLIISLITALILKRKPIQS